jgi:hypothetical protein
MKKLTLEVGFEFFHLLLSELIVKWKRLRPRFEPNHTLECLRDVRRTLTLK